jgi:hypothetical protein
MFWLRGSVLEHVPYSALKRKKKEKKIMVQDNQ